MNQIPPHDNSRSPGAYRQALLEEEESTDLRDYWVVIYRHRRAALAFFLLVVFFTTISIPWGNRLYTATATLYIPSQNRGVFEAPEGIAPGNSFSETQRKFLKSRSLVAQVIKDLGIEKNPHFTKTAESALAWTVKQLLHLFGSAAKWVQNTALVLWIRDYFGGAPQAQTGRITFDLGVHPGMVDRYLELLTVSPATESPLVELSFSSADPLLAKTVVNSHADTFINRNLETRFELTTESRQFLEKKLTELKDNIANSEKALNQFQKIHEIVSVDKGGNLLLEQLRKFNLDLTEARSKRIELESLHNVVQKRDNQLLSKIIDNPTIQQLRSKINDLELQLAQLSTKFKPTYRGVIALQQETDEARKRLDQEINRVVTTLERDYWAATAKERALAAETEKARRVALDLQEKAVEYGVLEREVASNRALYEAVFKKTKEAALTGEDPIPNLRIVDRAEIPVLPAPSKATRTLLFGVAVALFGGIGLAFLLHSLDNGVRTPEDVARFFRLSTLGVVPDFAQLANGQGYRLGYATKIYPPHDSPNGEGVKHNQLLVSHHPLSLMAEMYRSICTAILFSKADKPPQTILITSSQANEGKTVTAINISMMLAQSRGPVLLIDADLHGGQCDKLLGVTNGTGLTNVLTGNGDAAQFIKKTNIKNLSLLGRGTLPPNPADLLGSQTMRQTLAALAGDFRFIVIDSAPLLPVSDSVLLATQVDGVILVARGQEVSRNIVRKARERLDYVDAKILGVVLNGIDVLSAEYGEYRHVYQSHYTRYGEGRAEELWKVGRVSANQAEDTVPAGSPEIVAPEFFDCMVKTLAKFVGPMAFIMVEDQITALGESLGSFPHSRLNELIDSVGREIPNRSLRISFTENMSMELQSLTSDRDIIVPPADKSTA